MPYNFCVFRFRIFFFFFQTFYLWELMSMCQSLTAVIIFTFYWNRKSYAWNDYRFFFLLSHYTNLHSWIYVEIVCEGDSYWLKRGDTFLSADRHNYEMKPVWNEKKTEIRTIFNHLRTKHPKYFEDEWCCQWMMMIALTPKHIEYKNETHLSASKLCTSSIQRTTMYFDCCVLIIIIC